MTAASDPPRKWKVLTERGAEAVPHRKWPAGGNDRRGLVS